VLISLLASPMCWAQGANAPDSDALQRADAAFKAGYAARQAGNLAEAQAQFAEVVRLAPAIPEAHAALGEVLVEVNKPDQAVPELEAAFKLRGDDPGIEGNLALAYFLSNQPAAAVPHFQAVYSRSLEAGNQPVDSAFCEAYARALAAVGKQSDAIAIFRAAEEKGGNRADLADDIGSLYAQLGQTDQARAEFERAIAADRSFALAHIHLGVLLRQQHDLPGSLSALTTASDLSPDSAAAQLELGRTFAAAGRDEDALPHLQRAAELDTSPNGAQGRPDLNDSDVELAMALQRLGRQQEAIPWFEKAVGRDPRNSSALTNLGLALTLTGKAKEALPYFRRAGAEDEKNAVVQKDLGVAHLQLSAFDDAIVDFKAALAIDPGDPQLHYDLGLAYKFKDRADDAVAELSRAAQLDPALQDPPYTLGILYMQMGKLDEAVTELKKAAALRPGSGDVWAILGSTLKQDGHLDEAQEALEKAIPLLPNQPGPRVTLAGVLADEASASAAAADAAEAAGDQQKALQQRAQAAQLRTQAAEYRRQGAELARSAVNRQKASFALNAGNQLMLKGQIADAVARYQESIADDPTFSEAHSQLAVALDRQGRAADAAAERRKAEELSSAQGSPAK
jgi:tetratricopeptide (TPR) repeat protein